MKIYVDGDVLLDHTKCSISLKYYSLASTFSINGINTKVTDIEGKKIYIKSDDDSYTFLTGFVMASIPEPSSNNPSSYTISGYSQGGLLNDVDVHIDDYPLEVTNISLFDIVDRFSGRYEVGMSIEADDLGRSFKPFEKVKVGVTEKLGSLFSRLAIQRGLFLTHLHNGSEVQGTPLLVGDAYNLSRKISLEGKIIDLKPNRNLQAIHSPINVHLETTSESEGKIQSFYNDFISWERPKSVVMKNGKYEDMEGFAKKIMSSEMVNIKANGTTLENVAPGDIFSYGGYEWFITDVSIVEEKDGDLFTFDCVNSEAIK